MADRIPTGTHVATTPGDVDLATTPKEPDKSLGELVGELTENLGQLFRQEVELARVETKDEVGKAGKAAGFLAAAALSGYLALMLASFALVLLLDEVMPTGLAFTIVAAAWAIVAAVLYADGRHRMREVEPMPRQTIETLKEDVQWARTQTS